MVEEIVDCLLKTGYCTDEEMIELIENCREYAENNRERILPDKRHLKLVKGTSNYYCTVALEGEIIENVPYLSYLLWDFRKLPRVLHGLDMRVGYYKVTDGGSGVIIRNTGRSLNTNVDVLTNIGLVIRNWMLDSFRYSDLCFLKDSCVVFEEYMEVDMNMNKRMTLTNLSTLLSSICNKTGDIVYKLRWIKKDTNGAKLSYNGLSGWFTIDEVRTLKDIVAPAPLSKFTKYKGLDFKYNGKTALLGDVAEIGGTESEVLTRLSLITDKELNEIRGNTMSTIKDEQSSARDEECLYDLDEVKQRDLFVTSDNEIIYVTGFYKGDICCVTKSGKLKTIPLYMLRDRVSA